MAQHGGGGGGVLWGRCVGVRCPPRRRARRGGRPGLRPGRPRRHDSVVALCCVSASAEQWSARLERPVGQPHGGERVTRVRQNAVHHAGRLLKAINLRGGGTAAWHVQNACGMRGGVIFHFPPCARYRTTGKRGAIHDADLDRRTPLGSWS